MAAGHAIPAARHWFPATRPALGRLAHVRAVLAARPVVTRAVASLPAGEQPRVVVRELPAAAFAPEPQR